MCGIGAVGLAGVGRSAAAEVVVAAAAGDATLGTGGIGRLGGVARGDRSDSAESESFVGGEPDAAITDVDDMDAAASGSEDDGAVLLEDHSVSGEAALELECMGTSCAPTPPSSDRSDELWRARSLWSSSRLRRCCRRCSLLVCSSDLKVSMPCDTCFSSSEPSLKCSVYA